MSGAAPAARRPRLLSRAWGGAKGYVTREDVPPGSWLLNAGGTAALGGKVFAQLITPGLSWRREFIRQYVFAFQVTLLPATVVAFVIGLLDDRHPGRLARLRVRRDRPDLAPPRRSPSCASSGRC